MIPGPAKTCDGRSVRLFLWLTTLVVGVGSPAGAEEAPAAGPGWTLVPEMERPAGILYEGEDERRKLRKDAGAQRALAMLEERVRAIWPRVREIDLVELSRFQVDATRGYRLPKEPGEFAGKVVGRDEDEGRWHLELRGPRLPARYDIVHRHLFFYATFDPATGEIGELVVTIRGWVLE